MTIGTSAISLTTFGQPANANATSTPTYTPRLDAIDVVSGIGWRNQFPVAAEQTQGTPIGLLLVLTVDPDA